MSNPGWRWMPCDFVFSCYEVDVACSDEKEVAETIDPLNEEGVDEFFVRERQDEAFGPTADSPGHMTMSCRECASGENEGLNLRSFFIKVVDPAFQSVDGAYADSGAFWVSSFGYGSGEITAYVEERVLDVHKFVRKRIRALRRGSYYADEAG